MISTIAPLNTSATPTQRQHVMPQHHQALRPYTEADVQLAIYDIQSDQIRSLRRAELVYKVPRRTIQRRRDATHCQRDYELNLKRLIKLEEEVII
ncbi:hypothetical protein GQ44DRAFT_284728 [Phaeosphaeriaceae sp. PMI808]|nr:hypothetical protein GQ44DRAFT_284728 [Phaeosphaeriaceae sp. PMI808]